MTTLAPVELTKSYLLLNHGPVTLVSSAQGDRRNVMAASWAMPLDFDPPKVAVVIDSRSFTRTLIEASGTFVLSIPTKAIADKVLAAGSQSGRTLDKSLPTRSGRCQAARFRRRSSTDALPGWSAKSFPRPITNSATTSSLPRLLPRGPIRRCSTTVVGYSRMTSNERFTMSPGAASLRQETHSKLNRKVRAD